MPRFLRAGLPLCSVLAACSGGHHARVCDGGTLPGDLRCNTCWDHDVVIDDDGMNKAFLPLCGNPDCVPIATSGHEAPAYQPPSSTCDLIPADVRGQCPEPFTCDCLGPLLSDRTLFAHWNCYWGCKQEDGGVFLDCSVP